MKRKVIKKSVSIILSLILMMSTMYALTLISFAETTADGLVYEINNSGITITGYTGDHKIVTIPNKIEGKNVTALAGKAFSDTAIEEITIPKTVTSMASYIDWDDTRSAFYGANSLNKVVFESGILTIPNNALLSCVTIEKIEIPDTVTSIGENAFASCTSLQEIDMSNKLQTIGLGAFYNCTAVTEVVMPSTLQSIGNQAFQSCTSLNNVILNNGLKTIGGKAFSDTAIEEITIPKTVTSMASYIDWDDTRSAFYGANSLNKIIFEDDMTTIPSGALIDCSSVKEVEFTDTVTSIGNNAFKGCTGLERVYGYTGSLAEDFANENNYTFITLGRAYKGFPDVGKNDWYFKAVRYCYRKGFIGGYNNGKFGPADNLKRQDFVVILARIAGADLEPYKNVASKMPDVVKGSYYAAAVNWAVDNKIINGYNNGKFGVGDPITREQVATILYRYMGAPKVTGADATLKPFADAGKISSFAKDAVVWAIQNGVISGKKPDTLAPTATASRAEIATIVMRMDQKGMFTA